MWVRFPRSSSLKHKTMELSNDNLTLAIELLSKADGEDIQHILCKIGMDDQILKQLVMSASNLELNNCIEERETIIGEAITKGAFYSY
jgi:hypothetical protein